MKNDCQKSRPPASYGQMPTYPSRTELAAMSYEEWRAYHASLPGGWLTTSAPEELLRACYAERLVTFDELAREDD